MEEQDKNIDSTQKRLDNLTYAGRFKNDKEAASLAGKNSVIAKRKKKMLRDTVIELLKLKAPDQISQKLRKVFPDADEKMTNDVAMTLSMILEATKGKTPAYKLLSDIVDGTPTQRVEHTGKMESDDSITVTFVHKHEN